MKAALVGCLYFFRGPAKHLQGAWNDWREEPGIVDQFILRKSIFQVKILLPIVLSNTKSDFKK
jgi:hypothetical protein